MMKRKQVSAHLHKHTRNMKLHSKCIPEKAAVSSIASPCPPWRRALPGVLLSILFAAASPAGVVELRPDAPVKGLGQQWHLYCGIPMPQGELQNLQDAIVVDQDGAAVPAQTRVMARWPGSGDIRWLGVDFVGNPYAKHKFVYGAAAARTKKPPQSAAIEIRNTEKGWLICTGPAEFLVPEEGALMAGAWLDSNADGEFAADEQILQGPLGELYVIDQQGRPALSGQDQEPDLFSFEPDITQTTPASGLLRLTVRREGWYTVREDGDRLARHITRLHFYAGQSHVRLEHTLVLTRNTAPGSYAERRNTAPHLPPVWFHEVGVRFTHNLHGEQTVSFADNADDPDSLAVFRKDAKGAPVFMLQEKGYYFDKTDPEQDCHFIIGEGRGNKYSKLREGKRCGDWVAVQGGNGGLALGVRQLWQQYPKELTVADNSLVARLWSPRGGEELDFRLETYLQRWPAYWFTEDVHGNYGDAYKAVLNRGKSGHAMGMAKTHELQLLLLPPAAEPQVFKPTMQAHSRPVTVLADPQWLYRSEAMSPLYPLDAEQFPLAETYMRNYFVQYCGIMETWGDYGFLDFGARPHVWYRRFKRAGHELDGRWIPYLFRYSPIIDYGFAGHLWRMYARSGERDYLELAEITARHRMDMGMVHWNEQGYYYEKQRATLYGKYRGGFGGAMNVFPWGAYTILHFNSGTELRHLYWHYYLRDYRRALEVAESYRELVKNLWQGDSIHPFTGTRPFATLKNLAVLYQETGDPVILEIGRHSLEKFVDLESPQGVTPKLPTGLAKYTTKVGAVERWYEATGDELAKKSLLRAAETYARTSLGNQPDGYYNIMARVLNRAYRITGDPLYARILKRNMELAVELNYDPDTDKWRDLRDSSAVSASNTAYPVGDMAIGMDSVTRAGDIGPVPLLQQNSQGRPVLVLFRKNADEAVTLDVRGRVPLKPGIFTIDGKPAGDALVEPFRRRMTSLKTDFEPNCFLITLPAASPAGEYILDAGVGGAPWEVTWSDAPAIVMYAPGGLGVNGGPPIYFKVPDGTASFDIYDPGQVPLFNPAGERIAQESIKSRATVAVPPAGANSFWSIRPRRNNAVFELRGLQAILACDTNRWFVPDLGRIPAAQFDIWQDYSSIESSRVFDDENSHYASGVDGKGTGLALNRRRALLISGNEDQPLLFQNNGTFEFWLRPDWSSVYGSTQNYVLNAGGFSIILNYQNALCSLFRLSPADKARTDLLNGLTLERGEWNHLAWQWYHDDNSYFQVEMYHNGQLRGSIEKSMVTDEEDSDDAAQEDGDSEMVKPKESQTGGRAVYSARIGHHANRSQRQGSLNGVIDNVRFSSSRRYHGDFKPQLDFENDENTLALFRFENSTEGRTGKGMTVAAELRE